ncbi:NAD(P)H-dependent oxidoreductase [Croceivirga sp. JEA036]|uniref:NAD(P)H-dependent oxidoreductase n=1 Tax=Croceivirga sp. JEA036 TaxID=2721162 RepID=UPI001438EA6E|nr:NAD(P)H-dependent oxidoreductase [Croceivirga sp. JEA036]NJB35939.1 NAD(P)H-dependent oxidoreductase [Croceivirga sp. JEA036]
MSDILTLLKWRYAVKKFDDTKKVSQKDLEQILEAIQLSASSYGLQPYEVFVVTDAELRQKLQPASWGQSQIVDASHLLIFANKTNVDDAYIDAYLENVGAIRNLPTEALTGYADFMKSKINELSAEQKNIWTAKQVYIALGNALDACAALQVDSCPMEGFDNATYNEILDLPSKGLNATVVLPIGYRSTEDQTQHYEKVRKSKEDLFTFI